jgi:heme-degrading monooxygenase HmoA
MQTVTLINAFEVPPDADDQFIARWERARDSLATRSGFGATALHRAWREDAEFRFVDVARVEPVDAWRTAVADPAFPGRQMSFKAHLGLYEVVREDGDPEAEGGVVLINPSEAPADADERILAGWDRACGMLAKHEGYMGMRLHRSLDRADFRFVNIVRWSNPLMLARALATPEYQQASAAMSSRSHPSLYQVIRD